jgi:hypothetical protein
MDDQERYMLLMSRFDADPRHWRFVWLKDSSARLVYLRDPLIKVSQALVKAVAALDADALAVFLNGLSAFTQSVVQEYPEYPLGGNAASLRAMVKLPMIATIQRAMPAIAIAGLLTVLMDDLDTATTYYCGACETHLERINLRDGACVSLCPYCDPMDVRWYEDSCCPGQDVRMWIQAGLSSAVGEDVGHLPSEVSA